MSRVGPFGLKMGMSSTDFGQRLIEVAPCRFQVKTVPKPHSAFERYVVQISPLHGLSAIEAIGKTVATSSFGVELRSAFEAMETKLKATYGTPQRNDFLIQDSIWNAPREWMQAILHKERVLKSEWSSESGALLPDSLSSIELMICAIDEYDGHLVIRYSFENCAEAEAEIAALEDSAL